MSGARTNRSGLGGFGALFFIGTLGAIATYVQRQSGDPDLELPRTSATLGQESAPAPTPVVLPWKNRLDVSAATFVPFGVPRPSEVNNTNKNSKQPAASTEGRLVQELGDGHRILLTLDPVLQDAALQIFRNREVPYAAAVMLDVRDNSVLVLAGHSTADPKVDPMEVVATAWAPAASVFKLVTTAALLEKKAATPTTKVCFSGGLHGITDAELRDVPARDTQCETLASAIAHSYNLVIAKLALANLQQDELLNTARKFQFESDIPFELNIERSPAHIPSDPIERAKVAAGFWNIDMSPIHGALLASTFARQGILQPPHIIASLLGPDGSDLTPALPKPERIVNRDVAMAIGAMMEATTTRGTARTSFVESNNEPIDGISVAGKTGSLTGKRSPGFNYNWFVGYAPEEQPEIAFAVLLANTPKWRIKAHYAARRLVQLYRERRDAIAIARSARLTGDGLTLPERDASGAIISHNKKPVAPPPARVTPPSVTTAQPKSSQGTDLPTKAGETLPPVPGPLPTPIASVAGDGA